MSALKKRDPTVANRLLAALPVEEYARLLPNFEDVALTSGEDIYRPDQVISYVYFPSSGVISVVAAVETGAGLEVGLIGKEGMAGFAVFLGVKTSHSRAVVQGAGSARRMTAANFLTESRNGGLLPQLLRRYTHSILAQAWQSAACYRFHPAEARLARWLLLTADRLETSNFQMTQEFLSNMLGVRREAVNKAAVILHHQQLIRYSRGNLTIIDRAGLEKASCPCYGIIKAEEKSFPLE